MQQVIRRQFSHDLLRAREQGQAMILIALLLVPLLGFVGLVVDYGFVVAQRRQMQNAADAAALAGARTVALSGNVNEVVQDYGSRNKAGTTSWTQFQVSYPDARTGRSVVFNGIYVRASTTYRPAFLPLFGIDRLVIEADSKGLVAPAGNSGAMLPLAVHEQPFVFGQTYTLWDDDLNAPGGFGWVKWDGMGNSNVDLIAAINDPSLSGDISVGDWIGSATGNMFNNQVQDALEKWRGKHVTVPIYDVVQGTGSNAKYHVVGFAEFVYTESNNHGNPKWIKGSFISWITRGRAVYMDCASCAKAVRLVP